MLAKNACRTALGSKLLFEGKTSLVNPVITIYLGWTLLGQAPLSLRELDHLVDSFHYDFAARGEGSSQFELVAPSGGVRLIELTESGLRLDFPRNRDEWKKLGVQSRFRVCGDFDIVARYEILSRERPAQGMSGGPMLWIMTDTQTQEAASLLHRLLGQGAVCTVNRKTTVDGKRHSTGNGFGCSDVMSGRLRLLRLGSELHFLAAPGETEEFQWLDRIELGMEDVVKIQFAAEMGSSPLAMQMLLKDITVRAERLPGLVKTTVPRHGYRLGLIVAISLLLVLGVAGWQFRRTAHRQRGANEARIAEPPSRTVRPVQGTKAASLRRPERKRFQQD